jgi:hypothetical protein
LPGMHIRSKDRGVILDEIYNHLVFRGRPLRNPAVSIRGRWPKLHRARRQDSCRSRPEELWLQ